MLEKSGPLLTPNQITTMRLFATLALFALWFSTDQLVVRSLICVGFALIFIADAWDGLVARRHGLSTVFGIYFDPVVDQISYTALAILMVQAGLLPLWFLFVYLLVTSLAGFVKSVAAARDRVVSASILAKVKADLVSMPLAGLYFVHWFADTRGLVVLLVIGLYWYLFKFVFDPSPEHTRAMPAALFVLALVFALKPESWPLADYYAAVHVVLALTAHTGSMVFYGWDNRDLLNDLTPAGGEGAVVAGPPFGTLFTEPLATLGAVLESTAPNRPEAAGMVAACSVVDGASGQSVEPSRSSITPVPVDEDRRVG